MILKRTFKNSTQFDRNMKLCQLRMEKDMTIIQLADYFGISKQRIQKILERDLDKWIKLNKKVAK